MKVLIVGGGGREHTIAWKLSRSPRRPVLYCAPGNAGTAVLGENVDIGADQVDRLLEFAQREAIDLTIVGPEDPLCAGIVDRFEAAGLRIFGPRAGGARLEGDKAFAKQLMKAAGVPTADARIFAPSDMEIEARRMAGHNVPGDVPARVIRAYDLAREYVSTRSDPLVVKASGLARGKGAFVCADPAEALRVIEQLMVDRVLGEAGDTVVVEERLTGAEVSVLALVDGRSIYLLEPARDYKRLEDGDSGPNTGGMGAFSPVPSLTEALTRQLSAEVFVPIVDALRREGIAYRGVLYAGIMLTAGGPKVLEFNCRFGDPETQPILMRLRTDLLDVIEAVIDERLDEITLEWDPRPALCVVLASGGYPDSAVNGLPISGLAEAAAMPDVEVFHAATRAAGRNVVTNGGRVLGVTALGETTAAARERAYQAVRRIRFEGMRFRTDVGIGE